MTLFLVGVLLILFGEVPWGEQMPHLGPVLHDLLREVGIAGIVAGLIAILIEIYRSEHHRIGGMSDVIDAVQGERMSPEVWLELKDLLSGKQSIRRSAKVRLEIRRDPALPQHQGVLRVEYEYQLHALTSKAATVVVEHELDDHLMEPKLNLPRFEKVAVSPSCPQIGSGGGKMSFSLRLKPRGEEPCIVRTERFELVNIPGSYNLYTTEFMKGLSVSIVGYADPVEVSVRPQGEGQVLVRCADTWTCGHLLLPGQGIEVKFKGKAPIPSPAPSVVSPV